MTTRASRGHAALLVCMALWGHASWSSLSAAAGVPRDAEPALEVVSPARVPAARLVAKAASRLRDQGGDPAVVAQAIEDLWRAATDDPWLTAAWVNLSGAYILECRPRRALFAAMVARSLSPADRAAIANLRHARGLACEEPEREDEVEAAEWAAIAGGGSPDGWRAAAQARRKLGQSLLAALYERLALAAGAPPPSVLPDLAGDLERAGMWRAAASVLAGLDDESAAKKSAEITAKADKLRPAAERAAEEIAARLNLTEEGELAGAIGLVEMLLARGESNDSVVDTVFAWYGGDEGRVFAGPWGSFRTSSSWQSVQNPNDRWPSLVLRRFPGDTQVAVYRWLAPAEPEPPARTVERRLARQGGMARGRLSECEAGEDVACLAGLFEIDLGVEGAGTVIVALLGVERESLNVAVVTLVGDAGCGAGCEDEARAAARKVVESWTPAEEPWEGGSPEWHIPVPRSWQASRIHAETEQPWRAFRLEPSARIDLPPGLVVSQADGVFRGPRSTAQSRLWFRGSFVDRDDEVVQVGDASFGGTVDLYPAGDAARARLDLEPARWAPRADPEARFVASADLTRTLQRAGTGVSGAAARYKGVRFEGEWLVLRSVLVGTGDLVEATIPVKTGAGSLSLLWIPLTARAEATAPPPPIVDLGERYEIRFQPLAAARSRVDPRSGFLFAAEMRVAVPRGFRISMNADASSGFPVSLRSDDGCQGAVERLGGSEESGADFLRKRVERAEGGSPEGGWRENKARGGRVHYGSWPENGKPERFAALLVPAEGRDDPPFLVMLQRGAEMDDPLWAVVCRVVRQSIGYERRR